VTVTGLGSLKNTIIQPKPGLSLAAVPNDLALPQTNTSKTITENSLTEIHGKHLYQKTEGAESSSSSVVFVHGLGGSMEFYTPLINALGLKKSQKLHLADFEGHGLSPTSPLSSITIDSLADDLAGIFEIGNLSSSSDTTLVAHSMGCLVALRFVIQHPDLVKRLVLLGPPPNPLPEPAVNAFNDRATLVRKRGIIAVLDSVTESSTSRRTKGTIGLTAARLSLLGTEPESYAKACTALAGSKALALESVPCKTLIITGDEDKVSPPSLCTTYSGRIPNSLPPVVLKEVGHWHIFEDTQGVATAIQEFL
jgi:pimeloyl-ACP methyl ester carboxylesterase